MTAAPPPPSRPVTEADLLRVERELRRWLMGVFGAVVLGAVGVGVTYGRLAQDVEENARRIETVRVEGSIPLRQLELDIAVIKEQQRANTLMLGAIAAKLRVGAP